MFVRCCELLCVVRALCAAVSRAHIKTNACNAVCCVRNAPMPVKSQLCVLNMESTAVAALAVAVDHVSAAALNSLVLKVEQLTRETEQLAQQALKYRRGELWMRAVITAALQDLRRGDLESVEGRLLQGDMYSGRTGR